jgi:hypothetical protein
MSGFKGHLGKVGLVVATSLATMTLAGGGVASAVASAVPANSVNSSKIVNNSIRSVDIRNGTIRSMDVLDNNLRGTDVLDGSLGTDDVLDGSLTGGDIADSSLTTFDLQDGTVASEDIADATIVSNDIQNGSIQAADLNNSAMTRWAKIDADATGTAVLRGRGVITSSRVGQGMYTVTFLQAVDACGWTATVNDNDAESAGNLYASVERNSVNDQNTLRVRTFDASGALTDTSAGDGFTVTVVC